MSLHLHTRNQNATDRDDLVVLVHGTYAASDFDEGSDWWQDGSDTAAALRQRLPTGTRMARQGEIFHWSGANSERARIKAAGDLLEYVGQLEEQGRGYHLVGHSHGGSVIWHTLRLAALRKRPLTNLRSWVTVGTPFLHHRTRGAWNVVNLLNVLLAVVLFRPAYVAFRSLATIVAAPILGIQNADTVAVQDIPERLSLFRTPVLKVLDLLGMSVATGSEGLRIGSFDSSRGDSIYEYLFLTPEGWLLLAVAILVIYVYLNLGGFFLSPVIESLRIRAEKRLERNAMETYQDRWLGIWSPDDEAINGLRATLDLSVSFVARMATRDRVLFSDHISLLSRPYYWVLSPLFNNCLRPIIDGIVRSFVVKTAQGNNRPAAEVIEVSAAPIHTESADRFGPVPSWLNQKLVDAANANAANIAPRLRRLLAEPSFVTGLETLGDTISGKELIHTSYFDHPEILDLLVLHMTPLADDSRQPMLWGSRTDDLERWLADWKAAGMGLAAGAIHDRRPNAPVADSARSIRRAG
jgi:hypothetical protein